jgi:hypothetical protein
MSSEGLEFKGFPGKNLETPSSEGVGPVPVATDDREEIARDVSAVGLLEAIPTLLDVLCEITGIGLAGSAGAGELAGDAALDNPAKSAWCFTTASASSG